MSRPGPSAVRVTRTASLPCHASSPAAARRFVTDVLAATDHPEWVDAASLAVSEVVTNVVLHAHTDLDLSVEVSDEQVLVRVRDRSPALPLQRDYNEQATTGRGMALVAALSSEHGVDDLGPQGKTVWFAVAGDVQALSDDDLLAAWDDAEWDVELGTPRPVRDEDVIVRLVGLPPTLWLAARQHHDALVRELVLYLSEHDAVQVDVPAADRARSLISTAVVAAVEHAQRIGTARRVLPPGHPSPLPDVPAPLDLELCVSRDDGASFGAMQDTLDVAERLAAAGLLLARPGLPEIVAVRDWACEQVLAQLAGVTPAAWPGTDQDRFTTVVHEAGAEAEWDEAAVRDSDENVVAADDANRIVAISRSLASLLGWEVDDLVGRRVVTLVPPALREAHVAGFTRHLTTGEAHVLDVPLVLPVLRADGTEITARFVIQTAPGARGRAVYLAHIDPLPGAAG
jgi:PAS domain S-box-containing protein